LRATHGPAPALVATYRLQLHRDFTFFDAADLAPYLADLGVSHLYLSPVTQAVPGSRHGYDQCDPTRLSDDLGGDAGFRRLASSARAHGLGILLDIVPNHMAASGANPWWWELLRSGRHGRAGAYFDIDWEPGDGDLDGRVMVPVLGAPLEEVLGRGELGLDRQGPQPVVTYFDQRFPLDDAAQDGPLPELLATQNYLLAHWREALRRLNYRRFFDINSLVALREEDPAVFVTVHELALGLVARGDVQGLRVDHVDGLSDPLGYLVNLRRQCPGTWIVVEKILGPGELLPGDWPVAGTTGYDFIQRLQGVFVDPASEAAMTAAYAEFTGHDETFEAVARQAKGEAADALFRPDLARLERLLEKLCAGEGVASTAAQRARVLRAVAVAMPVYRAYGRPGHRLDGAEKARVEGAVASSRDAADGADRGVLDLLARALLGELQAPPATELATRFQQLSGPLMAKGLEDTAFYRYNRLVCLNEVGGDPGCWAVSPAEFHAANATAAADHPTGMLASSTHDTKRSEDVRARLALLSQVPEEWAAAVRRWSAHNDRHRAGDRLDRDIEYLLYQALVGAWPLSTERALEYLGKAAREAKWHTSWIDPDPAYEYALEDFVTRVTADEAFLADVAAFVEPLVEPGFIESLAQVLLKLTSPGVPDIYQGAEAWDLSLVDPDNRRPVDYALRRELLSLQQRGTTAAGAALDPGSARWEEGLAKVHVTARALATRASIPAAFGPGSSYTPLPASGPGADHVLAFARGTETDPLMVVTVVPRLTLGREVDWAATSLSLDDGPWCDNLWGGDDLAGPVVGLDRLFRHHTLALLERA
jgi:(1->4)-alpha-D-glucan 1-alpha-D-glucosylmutase